MNQCFACAASFVLATSALAQVQDDTAEITSLVSAAASNGGGTIQLLPKAYFYRGGLALDSVYGPIHDIQIKGDPTGQTRIIAGIRILPSTWKKYADLPTSDPWKTKFATGGRSLLRWVDLSPLLDTGLDSGIGSWPAARATEFSQESRSLEQPAVVCIDGLALKLADEYDSTYPWRVASGSTSIPTVLTTGAGMAIKSGDPETRCTVFTTQDYSPCQVGVAAYSTVTKQITLAQNPFLPGESPSAFNFKQRFRLFNSPEFLNFPGEMVLDTARKRIFFIPRSTSGSTELVVSNSLLNLSTPAADTYGELFKFTGAERITVSDISVENFSGCAFSFRFGQNLKFERVAFKGVGTSAIDIAACSSVSIDHCTFADSYRGFISINDMLPYNDPRNSRFGGFATLNPNSISISECTFTRSGSLFPSSRAISLGYQNVGTTINRCSFTSLYGSGVIVNGANNIIQNCTFDSCLRDITDAGVVYGGGSAIQIGNTVANCLFKNNVRPLTIPGSLQIDCSAVFIDNFGTGWKVVNNTFDNNQVSIKMNGGRFNFFRRNKFRGLNLTDPNTLAFRSTNRMGGSSVLAQVVNEVQSLIDQPEFLGFTASRQGGVNGWPAALASGAFAYAPKYNDLKSLLVLGNLNPYTVPDAREVLRAAGWTYFTEAYQTDVFRNFGNVFIFSASDFEVPSTNPFKHLASEPIVLSSTNPVRDINSLLKSDASDPRVHPNTAGVTGIYVIDGSWE